MIDPVSLIALTVGAGATASVAGTIISPAILMWMTQRAQQKERAEDRAERREIAKKVDAVRQTAQAALVRTDEVAQQAANIAQEHTEQLTQIHGLVNSEKTAALKAQLHQTKITLSLLKRFVALNHAMPSPEDAIAIRTATMSISELEAILKERGVSL